MSVSCLEKIVCSFPFFYPLVASKKAIEAQSKAEDSISKAKDLHLLAANIHAIYSRRGAVSPHASELQETKIANLDDAAVRLEKKRIYCVCGIASNILSIAIISVVALSLFPIFAVAAAPFIVWTGTCIYDIYETNKSFESIKELKDPPG